MAVSREELAEQLGARRLNRAGPALRRISFLTDRQSSERFPHCSLTRPRAGSTLGRGRHVATPRRSAYTHPQDAGQDEPPIHASARLSATVLPAPARCAILKENCIVSAHPEPSRNAHPNTRALQTGDIRNIALVGHAGAGKTLLLEALLLAGGAIQTAGSIDHGNTVSDTDQQEKTRAHSIDSCLAHLTHDGCHINLIDTAGHAEFFGATLSALSAVETVAVVVNAINGIEPGTRQLMAHARERGLARLLVINKIDFDGADLGALVEALREAFGSECLPVNLPAGHGPVRVGRPQ